MHMLVGGTLSQFRTCKAHYLARSVGRPKRRFTGACKEKIEELLIESEEIVVILSAKLTTQPNKCVEMLLAAGTTHCIRHVLQG